MDYKYIEQLLERYWECQTTLEEETILRKFFAQEDIPASLLPYRDLFLAEENMAQAHLSEDFDARLMERLAIGQPTGATLAVQKGNKEKRHAKVIKISITQQLRPLYRAAAMEMAQKMLANAPVAISLAKQSINENYDLDAEASLELENKLFGKCFATRDQKEGMAAFLEKRHANFTGE